MQPEPTSPSIFSQLPELPGLPSSDDSLFAKQPDWWNNACLNWSSAQWSLYAAGYKEAADLLVGHTETTSAGLDTLVYPVLFLYRQYLELKLKLAIRTCRHLLDDERSFPTGHRIDRLWVDLDQLLRRGFPKESTAEIDQTGRLIREFSEVDPASTAYRYPTDREGNQSLPGMTHLNLRNVRDVMAKIDMFLIGAHSQAYEELHLKLELEEEFRQDIS
jgi:hypothetical protein